MTTFTKELHDSLRGSTQPRNKVEKSNGDTFLTYVPPVVCYNLWKKCVIRKGLFMGVRNKKRETLARLNSKTLDARFINEIQNGLNCSPFESEAVLDVVKEVYFPFLDEQSVKAPPGKITLIAVSADEPAGKPVVDCEKQSVCLTIHRGSEDDRILQERGAAGFRQARIIDLCQDHLRPKDCVRHGQIVWTAVGVDNRPGRHRKMADTDLVTVVVDASTPEDI